ncbi:glycosyl transferase [Corynebacterium sp. HMSC055G02]|uniref:glycosyltransferase n=1 Tax=unclassified Corynebacterium TaxID=2624378 RepID=UPI0008A1473B|nr:MULTISPECIES: glycosyltransferase [unclassified Corynebacterium]MBC6829430.1 glycosyltransferase family 2 protein [Corynebacterium sp. LK32]OFN51823.1 glycosyl transferase [Corynebacterium sp. HMSC055G02]
MASQPEQKRTHTPTTSSSLAVERLQRILLPKLGEPRDVRSLYLVEPETNVGRVQAHSRTSATIPAGDEVSFETYFNAFPASYWRRWTNLDNVVLRLELSGTARVDIYRSKIDGARIAVTGEVVGDLGAAAEGAEAKVDGKDVHVCEIPVPLTQFEDGGWIWFDLTCETDVVIHSAGWYSDIEAPRQTYPDGTEHPAPEGRVTIGIPTFNRPTDAVAALEALSSDPEVDAIIDAILMPDQGTKHPADEPGFDAVAEHFGDRLRIFPQGNLGGSGGYSRIMYEALGGPDSDSKRATDSPFILYMDDDIAIEPDSILRAVAVGRFAKSPMLVGGQMLNLQERSHLHSMGEVIGRHDFMWTSAPHVHYDHDFYAHPLRDRGEHGTNATGEVVDSKDLHRRIDVEFNGWWMCLIPRVAAEAIGQPLPLFIKWDDAEYGLRAGKAGFPTATWPGVAIWHMAWSDKDDAIDWQAYFHLRNRLIVAALQYEGDAAGIVRSMRKATFKHLLCLEYSTVAIQNEAMKDFLAGPERLFDILESSLPRINALRKSFPDAVVLPSAGDLPKPSGIPGVPTKDVGGRLGKLKKVGWLAKGLLHSVRPENSEHHAVPQANLAPLEARWFSLSRLDGATVTTADGRGVVYRQRDRDKAKALLEESWELQKQVEERFEQMQARYRAAYDDLTSRKAWANVFEN